MSIRTEQAILKGLARDNEFSRKVIPYLKPEYFRDDADRLVFNKTVEYISKYNNLPSPEALVIELGNLNNVSEELIKRSTEMVLDMQKLESAPTDTKWLVDTTERFCKESALYNAIMDSIKIMDDNKQGKGKSDLGALPDILTKALAVSFDTNVGHDYLEDHEARYDFYHSTVERIPFDLEYLNKLTKGGAPRKTMNIVLGGVNVGKTLTLCHLAAGYLSAGQNVLYITLEMAQERIAERIDANLLDININDLVSIPENLFDQRIGKLKNKITGKLIIKEYPTSTASVLTFRALLNELRLKKNFAPDVIIVDYINICASSRVKLTGDMYGYVKAVAEELRGLFVEYNVVGWTATQLNRQGYSSSDPDMTNTAESFGLPATADFMVAFINTEEMEALGQYLVKQLKNRYNDTTVNKRGVLGVDRGKMRLYDVEENASDNLMGDDRPVFDGTKTGQREKMTVRKIGKGENPPFDPDPSSNPRSKFSGIKV